MEQKGKTPYEQWLGELSLNMLPVSDQTIYVKDTVYMDDNLDGPVRIINTIRKPIKMMMAVMLYCAEGTLDAVVNRTSIHMKKGDLLVSMPGDIIETIDTDPSTRIIAGAYKFDRKSHDILPMKSAIVFGKSLVAGSSPRLFTLDQKYATLFIQLYMLEKDLIRHTDEEFLEDAITSFMTTVMCMLASHAKSNESGMRHTRESELFAKFIDNVHTYASKERSVSFYADLACLSPKYFSRVITTTSGQKPGYWISNYVVLEAKAMLGTGQFSISQISDALNFPNPSFFCKYFKGVEGCSPGEYLKEKSEI